MNKIRIAWLITMFTASAFSMDLAFSTGSIEWSDQSFVNLSISNIATGADVDLSVFLDTNHNGSLDTSEPLLAQFNLTDGQTNHLGATTFLDDRDGAENGIIASVVSFFGNSALHTLGDYIWQATELDGSGTPINSDTLTFSVTQPVSSTWITGEVRNYSTSNTVAGAYVELQYFSDTSGAAPSTWANENGEFLIYLPVEISATEALGIYGAATGYMSTTKNPEGDFISLAIFTNELTTGINALTQPLFVVPSIPAYDLVDITGGVYLIDGSETNVLPGVIVEIALPYYGNENNENEEEISSFDISNTNGEFSLVFPTVEDEWDSVILSCSSSLLNLRGLVSAPVQIAILEATNGIALYCYPAEALVQGTITDKDTTLPLIGMEVELTSGNDSVGSTYCLSNGTYEIGALSGSYGLQCAEDALTQQHYIYNNEQGYRYIGNLYTGEIRNEQNLAYAQGFMISGHVYTEGGSPLGGGNVLLIEPSEDDWEYRTGDSIVAFDGHYNLLAAAGTWNVRTENKDGYWIDLYYTNCLPANSATATPIVVSNAVNGIDFYLEEGARLQGTALTADSESMGVQVSAFRMNGFGELELVGYGETDWEAGAFDFVVSVGSDIYLRADSDDWNTPHTWLGNVGSHSLATLIHPLVGTTQTNLNIQLLAGYQVSASVKDQLSMADLPNVTVIALDSASNLYAQAIEQWGSWALVVPTNTPITFFAETDGYEGEFMTNTYDFSEAGYFQLPAGEYQPLEFILHASTSDTDNDGLPDYLEDSVPDNEFWPEDYSNMNDPDSDKDQVNDYKEYIAGTNPRNANSRFEIIESVPTLRWSSVLDREYIVQLSTDLTSGSWSNVYTNVATEVETSYDPATNLPHACYRILVEAP